MHSAVLAALYALADTASDSQPCQKPTALLALDVDYTMFGLSSAKTDGAKLFGESFWDDAYATYGSAAQQAFYGKVWGYSLGLVPDGDSLDRTNLLSNASIFSRFHPDFGDHGRFDFHFAIISDGSSFSEAAFNYSLSAEKVKKIGSRRVR